MALPTTDLNPTRYSLLSRLQNWDDQDSWRRFFDAYWRLIYLVAIKSGLTETEAQEVVQETVISVAKDISKFKREREFGSFRGWLRNVTRWRIADQLRKRTPMGRADSSNSDTGMDPLAQIVDPAGEKLEAVWDEEWRTNLLETAVERVRNRVREEHYQIFDLYVLRGWTVREVAEILGVSSGQVYLAKHRVAAQVRKEVRELQKKWY
jgi:RNA polymerase sigma-70 factor (ECF subfamily)